MSASCFTKSQVVRKRATQHFLMMLPLASRRRRFYLHTCRTREMSAINVAAGERFVWFFSPGPVASATRLQLSGRRWMDRTYKALQQSKREVTKAQVTFLRSLKGRYDFTSAMSLRRKWISQLHFISLFSLNPKS